MSQPFVTIKNVHKSYWRDRIEIPVLRNMSFDIPAGEFLALMGPSGSGKTTILNLLAGIDKPSDGTIRIGDVEVSKLGDSDLSRWRSQHVGFIFQFYNLMPVLTAFENVELPLLLTKLSKSERKQQVEMALSIVGLGDRIHHYPNQLSGGQEQRVAIARAIVTDPDLLLADEPTGDLDRAAAESVMDLLSRLNTEYKKTIVMVTHDPRAAEKAHLVRNLEKGELEAGSKR
jgi:putative ABC transport system ATP-binding protein